MLTFLKVEKYFIENNRFSNSFWLSNSFYPVRFSKMGNNE